MLTTAVNKEFIKLVASEVASGIEAAVECWIAQIERTLENPHLTTLGRLYAIQEIVANYKHLTGKTELRCPGDNETKRRATGDSPS